MSDNSILNFSQGALAIAGTVASAAAPPWSVVGATATLIGQVLEYFFNGTTTPSPVTIEDIAQQLQQQSATEQIREATASINTTLSSFFAKTENIDLPLPTSVRKGLRGPGQFSNLYNFLEKVVTGNDASDLVRPINSMAEAADPAANICLLNGDRQAAFLGTFAYGVSVYTLIATYWTSLVASVDGVVDSSNISLGEAINRLAATTVPADGSKGWIAYAEKARKAFFLKVNRRMEDVGLATPFDWFERLFETRPTVIYFSDGQPVDRFHPETLQTSPLPPWPGTRLIPGDFAITRCPSGAVYAAGVNPLAPGNVPADTTNLRNRYFVALQQQIYKNYCDPNAVADSIQQWKKTVERLRAPRPLSIV